MRILVTNDDGIHSVGIHRLAEAISASGEHEVIVVAPSSEQSGTSAALGHFNPRDSLDAVAMELPGVPGVEAWAVDGPPALCVVAAALGGFGPPPNLIVSGINAGLNTGRSVLHSGTVGAVLTGQNFGFSGLAVSLQSGATWHWDTAGALAVEVLPMVVNGPRRSAVNLNVPALPLDEVRGVRWARLAPFGEVRAAVAARRLESAGGDDAPAGSDQASASSDRLRLSLELQFTEHKFEDDTDQGVVRDGYAALTALVGVAEAWPGDYSLEADAPPTGIEEALVPGAPLHEAHRIPDGDVVGTLRRTHRTA